jgi:hypothetical protein
MRQWPYILMTSCSGDYYHPHHQHHHTRQ